VNWNTEKRQIIVVLERSTRMCSLGASKSKQYDAIHLILSHQESRDWYPQYRDGLKLINLKVGNSALIIYLIFQEKRSPFVEYDSCYLFVLKLPPMTLNLDGTC
jgi:hypothetical protein